MTTIILPAMDDASLLHYGILRRSGRYPWGSGGNVANRSKSFLDYYKDMQQAGLTEAQIAEGVGLTVDQLRSAKTLAIAEKKAADVAFAQRLSDKGVSNTEIAKRLGVSEGTVRNMLKPGADEKAIVIRNVAEVLRKGVEEKGFIDVGKGIPETLDISPEKLKTALSILQDEGYEVHPLFIPQVGTGEMTRYKILAPPGTTKRDVWLNRGNIAQWNIDQFSDDGGKKIWDIAEPLSIDPSRVSVRYAEDGGTDSDGTMFIRPGVSDVSIGANKYAQVRVKVGDDHYLKGMAVYKDDLPDGVDILFNTNKSNTGNKLDAMKKVSDDPENPFKSVIKRQLIDEEHFNKTGEKRATSVMNILSEEGDWDNWSRTLSSQFLSKQSHVLAKEQLDLLRERRNEEFAEISALTNPVVKRALLNQFADSADSAAVHLKAAGMPGQSTHVILPMNSMKITEVYAPNFENGQRVVLVRHPHGGVFEIPELVVNNKNPTAKSILGNAKDAIGINSKVAEQLSGADFDGDTVLVIPNNSGRIRTKPPLQKLKGFDPKESYKKYDGMKVISEGHMQKEMGRVSNLITDMTILGASDDELVRAVRHSMVIIDSYKHELDWKRSARENGIRDLQAKYLDKAGGGASTVISKAKSPIYLPERKVRTAREGGGIDPATGKKIYVETGRKRRNRETGELEVATKKYKTLEVVEDAFKLNPRTEMERVYAEHSNRMKALANKARKEMLATENIPYNKSAKKTYAKEVEELRAALKNAKRAKPLERQAQIIAQANIRARLRDNPEMDDAEKKKIRSQALAVARARTQAGKAQIEITPRQWEAIQAGAISNNFLKEIVDSANMDQLKELATPRTSKLMTSARINQAKSLAARGYTQAEIASQLGVSLTTLKEGLAGD